MALPLCLKPEGDDFPYKLTEGTIIVNRVGETPFFIKIQSGAYDYISLEIREEGAKFLAYTDTTQLKQLSSFLYKPVDEIGCENKKASYWFSFNRDDRVLKYGKGYVMNLTKCMEYTFPPESYSNWDSFFDPAKKKSYTTGNLDLSGKLGVSTPTEDVEEPVYFLPYPLIDDLPYLVRDSANATMFDLGSKQYLLSANLPMACQQLYAVIGSPKLNLEEDNLAEAIGYSLEEKDGRYLNDLLKHKGVDAAGMSAGYLRIFIGNGSSPGIPYVLELWKPGAKSQFHNHGNCYGLIKVVHGSINICVYNKTWPDSDGYSKGDEILNFNADKGKVTWLSPNWYQTHKLENVCTEEGKYCATIQCYKYGNDDHIMWPYFDYFSNDSTDSHIKEFKPQTDADFTTMRKRVLDEYANKTP